MKKSIEVEYWVIDQDGALTSPGELANKSGQVEKEFVDCLFELKTPPCETVAELRTTFAEQLNETLSLAAELDKHLVPLGTPINSESIEMLDGPRGDIQKAVIGTDFDYAKSCAGTHVHFEQRNVVDQLNTLLALDPALALCNSCPYYQGERLASSARAYLYRKKCYEDLPKHGQLWDYTDTVAQWKRRLDRRFEEFKTIATDNGLEPEAVDEHFSPDDVVWTPVRLRDEMPTVEWRSPDATLPSQILQLVGAVDDVMERIHHTNVRVGEMNGRVADGDVVLPEFAPLCNYAEAAMLDGLESRDVTEYLTRMGFTIEEYSPMTREFGDQEHISLEEARTLRLQYADRLREDVTKLVHGRSDVGRV